MQLIKKDKSTDLKENLIPHYSFNMFIKKKTLSFRDKVQINLVIPYPDRPKSFV